MRLFVAIKTSRAVNAALKHVSTSLAMFGNGSFCKEDMYHITLAFIGETDRAGDIIKAMDSVKSPPFSLEISGMGSFGNTYYVGVQPSKELSCMQNDLSQSLRSAGFALENRAFVPHITIARRYRAELTPTVFVPQAQMQVESIVLMESVGGTYKPLYTKALTP